jgi:lauroyl/myristoyl acyltransferase
MDTVWKKIRYRLEWLALKSATKFLPLLSRKACYRLALLLGSFGAMLDRRGRRVALSNLRVAFGDEISSERRAQIVRESYQHFARTMLDFFWSPRLTSQNFSRYVEFENRERWDTLRHLCSRVAAPAHGRATHQRPLRAAARRALPRGFSSPD